AADVVDSEWPAAPLAAGPERPVHDVLPTSDGEWPAEPPSMRTFPPKSQMPPGFEKPLRAVMNDLGITEVSVRASSENSSVWYGVGGPTVHDPSRHWVDVATPAAPAAEPVVMEPVGDGGETRPVFPSGPINGNTGAIFPTKPGSAIDLDWTHVVSINEARAARGLPSLQEAYPDLPLPTRIGTLNGQPYVVQQTMIGDVKPVITNWVKDESGRIIDGDILMPASDIDLVDVVGPYQVQNPDGTVEMKDGPWPDALVQQVFNPAVNRAYSESLGIPNGTYDVLNHPTHGVFNPELNAKYKLDKDKYWFGDAYTMNGQGEVTVRPLG